MATHTEWWRPTHHEPNGVRARLHPSSTEGSRVTRVTARVGLLARGLVYLVLGWLAVEVALGRNRGQLNQKGALADVATAPEGPVLLILLAVGLAAYALWQFSRALVGSPEMGKGAALRLTSLGSGLVYSALCVTAVEVLTGSSRTGQAQQQQGATARLMRHDGGRWLIGLVGAVVVIIGAVLLVQGVTRRWAKDLHVEQMSEPTRRVVLALGVCGSTARGLVLGLAGTLVIAAAVTDDPRKSSGLDGALRSLVHHPAGPWLLSIVAIGLIAFGLYSAAAVRWTRI
jgi:Domain of Unknown Function (DUF1206)